MKRISNDEALAILGKLSDNCLEAKQCKECAFHLENRSVNCVFAMGDVAYWDQILKKDIEIRETEQAITITTRNANGDVYVNGSKVWNGNDMARGIAQLNQLEKLEQVVKRNHRINKNTRGY